MSAAYKHSQISANFQRLRFGTLEKPCLGFVMSFRYKPAVCCWSGRLNVWLLPYDTCAIVIGAVSCAQFRQVRSVQGDWPTKPGVYMYFTSFFFISRNCEHHLGLHAEQSEFENSKFLQLVKNFN